MRIYIPATGVDIGRDALLPRTVHAVTDELRDLLPGDVEEVLEAVAMNAATDESLRVLAALAASGETVYPLRVVIAAEIEEKKTAHIEGDDILPTALQLGEPVGWEDVVSFHVDDAEAANDVVLAIGGDAAALERVTDDEDLMWFDVEERGRLIEYFG